MSDKYISFIIPHYGREPLLLETLQSIANQDYDLGLIEVLVVTQNKSLSTPVQKFSDQFNLSIHTQPLSCTISELRNYGSKKSKGNYLAFLDADVSISNNWIKCMLEELEKPGEGRLLVGARGQLTDHDRVAIRDFRDALVQLVAHCDEAIG